MGLLCPLCELFIKQPENKLPENFDEESDRIDQEILKLFQNS